MKSVPRVQTEARLKVSADPSPNLVAAVTAKQATLEQTAVDLKKIESRFEEISTAAVRTEAMRAMQLAELRRRREDAVASGLLGGDFQAMVDTIDGEIGVIAAQSEPQDLGDATLGLRRRLELAKQQLDQASKAEQLARLALLQSEEEVAAADFETARASFTAQIVRVQAFARLRKAEGIEGLVGGEIQLPSALLSPSRPSNRVGMVMLGRVELAAALAEETARIVEDFKKRGVELADDAIAVLQSSSVRPYTVSSPLKHNGSTYIEGDPIELPDVQAKPLLESSTIRLRRATDLPRAQVAATEAEARAA